MLRAAVVPYTPQVKLFHFFFAQNPSTSGMNIVFKCNFYFFLSPSLSFSSPSCRRMYTSLCRGRRQKKKTFSFFTCFQLFILDRFSDPRLALGFVFFLFTSVRVQQSNGTCTCINLLHEGLTSSTDIYVRLLSGTVN